MTGPEGDAEPRTETHAALLDAMTEVMTEGIIVVDEQGRFLRTNAAARRLLGLTETGFQQRNRDYLVYHRDGTRVRPEELPSAAAFATGTGGPGDFVLRYRNGREVVLEATAHRIEHGYAGAPAVVSVYRDVTEERRRTDQIADFAGVVAHDLRNPVASAQGWLELAHLAVDAVDAGEGAAATEVLRERLDHLGHALGRMSALVADLLAQADAEGGVLRPQEVVLDGDDGLVAEVARDLGCADQVELDPLDPVLVDPGAVHQLFANLLANAVKYARPGVEPRVAVRGRTVGPRVEVVVEDNGLGVPAGHVEHVFDRFFRAPEVADAHPGTGLGLAICRTVVERHDGSIRCTPRPDGEPGTRFTFDLPAAPG